jgi:hypothetical protein
VNLNKAKDLLGCSHPHVRRLIERKQLIAVQVGQRKEVSMYEIRRFLMHGNATEQDWKEHEGE